MAAKGKTRLLYFWAAILIASSAPFGEFAYSDNAIPVEPIRTTKLFSPDSIIIPKQTPNYDKQVLEPLHAAQLAKAEAEKKAAEEKARVEAEQQAAYEADLEATANRVQPFGTYNASSYAYHECVWYIATRIKLYPFLGNANNWPNSLPLYGFRQGAPRKGAIAISEAGFYGHAALVEEVSGSQVLVSEYNALVPYGYDERWVGSGEFFYFF